MPILMLTAGSCTVFRVRQDACRAQRLSVDGDLYKLVDGDVSPADSGGWLWSETLLSPR